jgi:flavin reductase (DIM6/NTAB) family NADH-FMN oxidoreductase RutF
MPLLGRRRRDDGPFVESPLRDNWYQSSSYWPSSFALVTTVDESGDTNVAPYQLSMPFEVIGGQAILLISRPDSNTVRNLRRTGIASLNYVEASNRELKRIVTLGYPGQTTQEKAGDNPFTLVPSPTPGRAADGERYPLILDEAFQVYECTVDADQPIRDDGYPPAYFVLRIDRILLRQRWFDNLESGGRAMPRMPITFGFRGGERFWFAQVRKPFWISTPSDRGPKEESILYEGNRIDPDVQFTREACQRLTGIPRPFVKPALRSMVKQAKEEGVSLIDDDFVEKVNAARQR